MKTLLLLVLMTSCGKGEVPLIGGFMQKWADDKNEQTYEELVGHKLRFCGEKMYNYSCTSTLPVARLLQPYELYSHHCYDMYVKCLESNNVKY